MDARSCIGRPYHRLIEDYRPMHGLCRFFLENSGPGVVVGDHEFMPFVVNMPRLFESFVSAWMINHLRGRERVERQYRVHLGECGAYYDIDLVIYDANSDDVLAVLDTKYKREPTWDTGDAQQVIAYAASMRTNTAFLVYPSLNTNSSRFDHGDIRGQVLRFDIGRDPQEAGRDFLIELRQAMS